jgi:hypothetical protein
MDELVAREDRHRDRLVFPGITDGAVRRHMYRACLDAGIVAYSPHDLRDRRISLWIAQGVDAVQAVAWSGHSKASMTLDVYAHVAIDPAADEWRDFWLGAYRDRAAHVVPMWSDEGRSPLKSLLRAFSALRARYRTWVLLLSPVRRSAAAPTGFTSLPMPGILISTC